MKNNYLIVPNSKEEIINLTGCNILYPLKSFSVGFNYYFELSEITEDKAYLYINRLLTSNDLDNLKYILSDLTNNIKGIVFEDLGVFEIIKEFNVEKIFYSSHILTNYNSINAYLEYFDTCVISPDITLNEVNEILLNTKKDLCIYGYGHMPLSYTRRILNTNYSKNYGIDFENNIHIKNTDYEFISVENEYGTVIYDNDIYSGLDEKYKKDIKYIIVNLFNIGYENFIKGDLCVTKGFLDKDIFYKLKEKK